MKGRGAELGAAAEERIPGEHGNGRARHEGADAGTSHKRRSFHPDEQRGA